MITPLELGERVGKIKPTVKNIVSDIKKGYNRETLLPKLKKQLAETEKQVSPIARVAARKPQRQLDKLTAKERQILKQVALKHKYLKQVASKEKPNMIDLYKANKANKAIAVDKTRLQAVRKAKEPLKPIIKGIHEKEWLNMNRTDQIKLLKRSIERLEK